MRKQENQLRPEYEAPKATVIEINSEGCILSASDPKGGIDNFEGEEWGGDPQSQSYGIF